jgi:ribosome-associated protein
VRDVEIRREPVELYKLLKFEGMASSGGQAKMLITEGLVTVNGETETRKRRKIVSGDVVCFAGDKIRIQTPHFPDGSE